MLRYVFTAIGVIALDHVVKWLVVAYMSLGQQFTVIPGVLGIASARNRGAAFSLLEGQQGLLIAITSAVLIGIILYFRKTSRERKLLSYGLAIFWGAAFGNFIDRVISGTVVDMFELKFMHFAIFNVADTCLWIGLGLILLDAWKGQQPERSSEASFKVR